MPSTIIWVVALIVAIVVGFALGVAYRKKVAEAEIAGAEEEAKRIRLMFRMAGKGDGIQDIQKALDRLEEEAGTGVTWNRERVRRTLRSVVYKGDVITGKTYKEGRKQIKNDGEKYPRYELIEHHAPIVTPELFDRVQELMNQRLLSSSRRRMTAAQKRFLQDESWMAGQDKLEHKRIIIEGGYTDG